MTSFLWHTKWWRPPSPAWHTKEFMLQITRLPPRIHALGKKWKKNLVDKKTASVSPLRHPTVKKKKVILSLCKILACTWITVEQKKGKKNPTGQDFLGVSASQMLCCTVRELVSWGGNNNCEYGETQEWLSDYGTEFVILITETVEHGQYSEKSQTKTRDTLSETGVAFLPSFLVHLCFKQRLIVKK